LVNRDIDFKLSNDAANKSTSKKEMLQAIRRFLPICQDIAYSFCFTGAETEVHKIKDDSKIIRLTNLDRRGLRPIPIICHLLDPPPLSRYRPSSTATRKTNSQLWKTDSPHPATKNNHRHSTASTRQSANNPVANNS
jgi:hypothetical protein